MSLLCAIRLLLCSVLILAFTASGLTQTAPPPAAGAPQTSVNTPISSSQAFEAALDDYWQYTLKAHPEVATIYGDNRYNDQISDWSPQFFKSDIEKKRQFLARFEAIPTSGLSQQQQLTKSLAERKLQE